LNLICTTLISTGEYYETEELTGESKREEYFKRNKHSGESPKKWKGKEWKKFEKYRAKEIGKRRKKERNRQAFFILLWVLFNSFSLFIIYYNYYTKDTGILLFVFVFGSNIITLFKIGQSFEAPAFNRNSNYKRYGEESKKIKEKRNYYYYKYYDRTKLEDYENNKENIVITARKNVKHLINFVKDENLLGGYKYFIRWWILNLEHLEKYLLLLYEKTDEPNQENTTISVGVFDPKIKDDQRVIVSQLDNIEGVFKVIAKEVVKENDPNIFKKETRKKAIKANIIRSLDRPTFALHHQPEQSTESFFLPQFRATIPFSKRKGHTYVVGGSGSGKSELLKLFLWNDIQHTSGNLVIEPHGQLVQELSALDLFKKHPEKLVYITPRFKDHIPHYNPLEYKYHHIKDEGQKLGLIKARATELTNAFEVVAKKDFSMQMKNLVKSCLIVLLHYEGMTLGDLMNFMNDEKNSKYVALARSIKEPEIKSFFREGGDFFARNYNTSKEGIRARIYSLLTTGLFADMINQKQSTFDIVKLLKEGKTVLVDLDRGKLSKEGGQAIGAFLLAELTIWGFTREDNTGKKILVYLDEMQNFVSPTLADALEEIRKKSIHFTMANQGLYQFAKAGFPEMKDAILNNTKVVLIGKVGTKLNDLQTAIGEAVNIKKEKTTLGKGKWILGLEGRPAKKIKTHTFLVQGDGLQVLGKENYMTKDEYGAVKKVNKIDPPKFSKF